MKSKNGFFSCALLLMLSYNSFAQKVDSSYQVGTWPGFRSAAVSFTFDDGCSNQFAVALPMFDKYNFKMTFFTVVNWVPNWTMLKNAAANAHEIASHTMTHANFGNLKDDQQTAELRDSKLNIETNISGVKCLTIAYPYCVTGNMALCEQHYIAARGCSGVVEPKTPSNFMNISSIICGDLGEVKTTNDFTSKFASAENSNGWAIFLIHGVDNDGGYSPLSSIELKGALGYLSEHIDKFWVAKLGDAARYVKERDNVLVKEVEANESSITISITDTLDNSIYNLPVSVRRLIPDGWDSFSVSQNNKAIGSQTVVVNSKKYFIFDVVPNTGNVVCRKIK
jgi:peptidoglycan-N-acetylglucosamine deacetylase